jgi:hypothetical protein
MKMTEWKIYPKPISSAFKSHVLTAETQKLVNDVVSVIQSIDSDYLFVKQSEEATMKGKILFSPKEMNKILKKAMEDKGWKPLKHTFQYEDDGFGFYEVDFLKNRVACEVQLGKYAFMSDNVLKLEIFQRVLGLIDLGILVVPSKCLQSKMSTGPGCFKQIIKRLDDLNYQQPLLVIGIS